MSRLPAGATILWLAPFLMLAAAAPASAHALGAECQIRKNLVELEAYFSDDTPAGNANVTVTDSDQRILIEGKTDEYGRWSFPTPGAGRYGVTVDAGDGHRVVVALTVAATSTDPPAAAGPSREEFTRTPWLGAGLGIVLIAAVAISLRVARSRKRERRSDGAGSVNDGATEPEA